MISIITLTSLWPDSSKKISTLKLHGKKSSVQFSTDFLSPFLSEKADGHGSRNKGKDSRLQLLISEKTNLKPWANFWSITTLWSNTWCWHLHWAIRLTFHKHQLLWKSITCKKWMTNPMKEWMNWTACKEKKTILSTELWGFCTDYDRSYEWDNL